MHAQADLKSYHIDLRFLAGPAQPLISSPLLTLSVSTGTRPTPNVLSLYRGSLPAYFQQTTKCYHTEDPS